MRPQLLGHRFAHSARFCPAVAAHLAERMHEVEDLLRRPAVEVGAAGREEPGVERRRREHVVPTPISPTTPPARRRSSAGNVSRTASVRWSSGSCTSTVSKCRIPPFHAVSSVASAVCRATSPSGPQPNASRPRQAPQFGVVLAGLRRGRPGGHPQRAHEQRGGRIGQPDGGLFRGAFLRQTTPPQRGGVRLCEQQRPQRGRRQQRRQAQREHGVGGHLDAEVVGGETEAHRCEQCQRTGIALSTHDSDGGHGERVEPPEEPRRAVSVPQPVRLDQHHLVRATQLLRVRVPVRKGQCAHESS